LVIWRPRPKLPGKVCFPLDPALYIIQYIHIIISSIINTINYIDYERTWNQLPIMLEFCVCFQSISRSCCIFICEFSAFYSSNSYILLSATISLSFVSITGFVRSNVIELRNSSIWIDFSKTCGVTLKGLLIENK